MRICIKIIRQRMEKWQKIALIFERWCFSFWDFFHRAVASPVFNVGDWILMDIPKPMLKCCRLIVLICVSVALPFRKCLRLLRLGLYTVSAPPFVNTMTLLSSFIFVILICWYIQFNGELKTTIWRTFSYFAENCLVAA